MSHNFSFIFKLLFLLTLDVELNFKPNIRKKIFIENGILCFSGVLMLNYSLTKNDLKQITTAFDLTCLKIKKAIQSNRPIDEFLDCVPGAPVFKGLREKNAVSN